MRSERRLVKERAGSVFRQQAPASLPVTRSNEPGVIISKPAKQQGEQKNKKDDGEKRDRREGR